MRQERLSKMSTEEGEWSRWVPRTMHARFPRDEHERKRRGPPWKTVWRVELCQQPLKHYQADSRLPAGISRAEHKRITRATMGHPERVISPQRTLITEVLLTDDRRGGRAGEMEGNSSLVRPTDTEDQKWPEHEAKSRLTALLALSRG